jgi:uncharacterized protein YjiS (DUF1127 family)
MKVLSLGTAPGRNTRTAPQQLRWRAWRHALRPALIRIFAMLREWRRRSRDRAELARFDDRMLRDIGVNRAEIWREINKPFWRQ